jgi:arginine utilization regulatory protein
LLESLLFGTAAGSFTGALDRPGLFELADGGTLLLDEMNSMELELQAKLLRVIQDGVVRRVGGMHTKAVDVRIIASTNEPPSKLLSEKKLRQDLYYRLNTIYLTVPPLRECSEDIKPLVEHFICHFNKVLRKNIKGVDDAVLKSFMEYSWPGNIRELEHVLESAVNLMTGDMITMEDLRFGSETETAVTPEKGKEPVRTFQLGLGEAVARYERQMIAEAVKAAGGNHSEAARLLKLPKQTLHNKLKKYDIDFNKS